MDPLLIIMTGVIMLLGSALQSAAGFAFGMFAIPMLILFGASPQDAITMLSVNGLVQCLVGVYHFRRSIVWLQVLLLIGIAGAMVPIGVATLEALEDAVSRETVRQVFGGLVLVALLVQWVVRVRPRADLHWSWTIVAMTLCGYIAGLSGMGGPPAVIWVMAHTWSNHRSRATLWALFAGLTPIQWYFLHDRFGTSIIDSMELGAMLIPVTLLGMLPGFWIGRHMSKAALRRVAYAILVMVGLYAVLSPVLPP